MLPRIVVASVLALIALIAAGCGGDDGGDAEQILQETFSNDKSVDSGVLEVAVSAEASGEGGGNLEASLNGPFQARETDQLPLVDFDATLKVDDSGQNTDFAGGLLIAEDAAYVTVDGQPYAVDGQTFTTFADLYAQSAQAQEDRGEEGSALFDQLGIDPSTWLTEVSDEGTEEIDGVETTHISGEADVAQIVEDAQQVDPTGSAGAAGSAELSEAVKSAQVDVFTGVDDRILRRLELELELEDPANSGESLALSLTLGFSDVNAEQSFEAPENARPLEEIVPGGLSALGGLGGLGGSGAGSGGGAGGGDSGGGGVGGLEGTSPEYLECVQNARSPEAVAECSDLL